MSTVEKEENSAHGYPLCHPVSPLTLGSAANPVLMVTEGSGCKVRDSAGNEYLDTVAGLMNTNVGYGNSEIIEAITSQLHRLSYGTLFGGRGNEPALELARVLSSMAPDPLYWVYLTGSGSESTELALRLAILYNVVSGRNNKRKIAYLDQSYHGFFAGSIGVSGLIPFREAFQPDTGAISLPTPNPERCPEGVSIEDFAVRCADALEEKARAGDVAAFIMEPILASAGVVIPPQAYFDRIQAICQAHEILLIVDEVATGFGRTGRWFASEHFRLKPDVILLSKGINSGYLPLGAVIFSKAIGEVFLKKQFPLAHASTPNGHPACCASALANIEIMRREKLVERADAMGKYFKEAIDPLLSLKCVKEIRGFGLMLALGLVQADGTPATQVQLFTIMKMLEKAGVLVWVENSVISFTPPLTITEQEVDSVIAAVRAVLSAIELSGGQVKVVGTLPTRETLSGALV